MVAVHSNALVIFATRSLIFISACPKVIKLLTCSTQLSVKFILSLSIKMPTKVSKILQQEKILIFHHIISSKQLKFHPQLS